MLNMNFSSYESQNTTEVGSSAPPPNSFSSLLSSACHVPDTEPGNKDRVMKRQLKKTVIPCHQ